MLQEVVNERFHQSEGIDQKAMATAKTDQFLVLKVPRVYHHNQGRYFQVVKLLPMVDTPDLRAQRTERWGKELLDPKTAGVAALRLEGLGRTADRGAQGGPGQPQRAGPLLRGRGAGLPRRRLGRRRAGRRRRPSTRVPRLRPGGAGAMDQAAATLKLRKLMDEADVEVRYGAFNALRTLDERDPFLGQVRGARGGARAGRKATRWRWPSTRRRASPGPRRGPVHALHGRLRGPPPDPRRADPALRDRRLRPGPEDADPRRPRHRRRSS